MTRACNQPLSDTKDNAPTRARFNTELVGNPYGIWGRFDACSHCQGVGIYEVPVYGRHEELPTREYTCGDCAGTGIVQVRA